MKKLLSHIVTLALAVFGLVCLFFPVLGVEMGGVTVTTPLKEVLSAGSEGAKWYDVVCMISTWGLIIVCVAFIALGVIGLLNATGTTKIELPAIVTRVAYTAFAVVCLLLFISVFSMVLDANAEFDKMGVGSLASAKIGFAPIFALVLGAGAAVWHYVLEAKFSAPEAE